MAPPVISPEIRFWKKVQKTESCWIWKGSLSRCNGYGTFWAWGKHMMAHQFSYRFFVGAIPQGKQIDHICRVRSCVNPDHLRTVTIAENVLCGEGLAAKNFRKTHCKYGHAFNKENTYWVNGETRERKGRIYRVCKECCHQHYLESKSKRRKLL